MNAKLKARKETKRLYIEFTYFEKRCRESITLKDTPANRRLAQKKVDEINAELTLGTFRYFKQFPESKSAERFARLESELHGESVNAILDRNELPLLKDYYPVWFRQNQVSWKKSHRDNVDNIFDKHLIPAFGRKRLDEISRSDVLDFRTGLSEKKGRGSNTQLSNSRINKIISPLKKLMADAAIEFDIANPTESISPLQMQKSDVVPFSINEVNLFLQTIRRDYKNYYTVRFFTGMRTGEIDGLKWKYIDFDRRLILVRETVVNGEDDTTKTQSSVRDIQMSDMVFDALASQEKQTRKLSEYVFCTQKGTPLSHHNVTRRIWYPHLKNQGIDSRRPYNTRHTTATLWLAAGESPEWVANQLGHSNTQMLFNVYSRFIPNLTRQDGSAFEKLIANRF